MSLLLVDTSVIIDFLRSRKKDQTLFFELFVEKKHQLALSVVVISELWAGQSLNQPSVRRKLQNLINQSTVLKNNLETAKLTGQIIRQLNQKGQTISYQDAAIAACAKYYQLPLVTLNLKDFKKIQNLLIYKQT